MVDEAWRYLLIYFLESRPTGATCAGRPTTVLLTRPSCAGRLDNWGLFRSSRLASFILRPQGVQPRCLSVDKTLSLSLLTACNFCCFLWTYFMFFLHRSPHFTYKNASTMNSSCAWRGRILLRPHFSDKRLAKLLRRTDPYFFTEVDIKPYLTLRILLNLARGIWIGP